MLQDILLAFIPIFVAVDPIGLLPIFAGLTNGIPGDVKRKVIVQAILTAMCLAVGFIIMGKAVFKLLGITIADFMIAGGGILFCIAILDILTMNKHRRPPIEEFGAVPIGTPLIVGPAVLTTSLISIDQHGAVVTIIAVLANILLVGIVFIFSDGLLRFFGKAGSIALSKIMGLLLAAIAVMMIRRGVLQVIDIHFAAP